MTTSPLPDRPSLEFLKKLAKERLQVLRRIDPRAKLAAALLEVAHDHGFSSWRALKTHVSCTSSKPGDGRDVKRRATGVLP